MKRALALVVAAATTLAACGADAGSSDPAPAAGGRTVEVVMTDMAYTPAALDVTAGETVTFVFRNDGAVRHEAVFGNLDQQEAHHAEMAAMADSGGGHGDGHGSMTELHAVVVEPGQTVEMTHTFDATGATMIGCHEPGHWEAGMKLPVDVA